MYQQSPQHIDGLDDTTPAGRALARDLIALVEAGLVAPAEGPDGQLRIALADEPEPTPPSAPACRARPDGPDLAPLSQLPTDVRVALVDAEPAFVVARSDARGVCSVAGLVLAHAVERVLGLPVVVAIRRGVGGLLLIGDEPHARAAARLDLAELRWVQLDGTPPSAGSQRAAA